MVALCSRVTLLAAFLASTEGCSLSAGDVAVIGFNVDNPAAFALVALADLPGGLTISVTTSGWTGNGWQANADEVHPKEWEHFGFLNELRKVGNTCPNGKSHSPNSVPLEFDCRLRKASQLHSQDMADQGYFSHTSQDGRSPWARAEAQGINANAENIAAGNGDAQEVLDQWENSDGHCKNMMNPVHLLFGVGYAYSADSPYRHYWTQMLKRQRVTLDTSCYPSLDLLYTTPKGGLAAGSVVSWDKDGGGSNAGQWTSNGGLFGRDDQVSVYCGSKDSPVFLFGLTSQSTSILPHALNASGAAVALANLDNYLYSGPTSGTRPELFSAIKDPANWEGDNGNRYTMPAQAFTLLETTTFTLTATSTTTDTLTATSTTTDTATSSSTSTITGNGAEASRAPGRLGRLGAAVVAALCWCSSGIAM